jgi:hypothetical protein
MQATSNTNKPTSTAGQQASQQLACLLLGARLLSESPDACTSN